MNEDDPAWLKMKSRARGRVLTFSVRNPRADLYAKNIRLRSDGVEMEAVFGQESCLVSVPIPCGFTVYNALGAMLAARSLGVSLADAASALKTVKGVKGRMETVPTPGKDYTVIIDYAHTPDGLENVLRSVRLFTKGRLTVLFGCGGDQDRIKRPRMGSIAAELADFVIVTSDNPRTEEPMEIIREIVGGMKETKTPYLVLENRREAIIWALEHGEKDDVILLAGKGHETLQTIGHERFHLDEREIVRDYLKETEKTPAPHRDG